jgi:hypothetical protein
MFLSGMRLPLRPLGSAFARLKTWGPATGFLGGFAWDAATLGRTIQSLDLFILLGYWLGAALLLWWLARRAPTSFDAGTDISGPSALVRWFRNDSPYFLLQFLFGGLFSALVIFYFKSAGGLPAFLLVVALAALMVLNEFLDNQYHRFTLTWALFGLCGIFFLNFALPHLFKSIHPFWFFASTALGVGATWGLRRLSPGAAGRFWPVPVLGGLLMGLFLVKAIPPVPLVLKGLAIGRNFEKTPEGFAVQIEKPPPWAPLRRSEKRVRHLGEPVYCVSSVFLPEGLKPRLVHRWSRRNPRTRKWETFSRIGFSAQGGRKQGFRGATNKRSLPPGQWKVKVESEGGRESAVKRLMRKSSASLSPGPTKRA